MMLCCDSKSTQRAQAAGYDSAVCCVQALSGRRVDEELEVGPCAMPVVVGRPYSRVG